MFNALAWQTRLCKFSGVICISNKQACTLFSSEQCRQECWLQHESRQGAISDSAALASPIWAVCLSLRLWWAGNDNKAGIPVYLLACLLAMTPYCDVLKRSEKIAAQVHSWPATRALAFFPRSRCSETSGTSPNQSNTKTIPHRTLTLPL